MNQLKNILKDETLDVFQTKLLELIETNSKINLAALQVGLNTNKVTVQTQQVTVQTQQELVEIILMAQRYEQHLTAKQNRKLARKRVHKKEARDPITKEELYKFHAYVLSTDANQLVKCRILTTCFILYVFGIRISNILCLTLKDLENIMNYYSDSSQGITLKLVKASRSRKKRLTYYPSDSSKEIYLKFCPHIKEYHTHLVSLKTKFSLSLDQVCLAPSRGCASSPMCREHLTRDLNKHLQHCFNRKKTFSSHSFRIGFLNSIISSSGVAAAQYMGSHTSPQTTLLYSRFDSKAQNIKEVMSLADLKRS